MSPPLALLHGAGCDAASFAELRPHLGAVVTHALELPGRAARPGPAPRSAAEAAADVARQLEALGAVPSLVLGHSYGGAVALELALEWPALVAGLVLVSTGARLRVHPALLASLEAAVASGAPLRLPAPWQPGTPEALIARFERATAAIPPPTVLADWRAADAFDRLADLPRVRCPALVLTGTEDPLTPVKYARHLATHLPDAELQLLEGAGHLLPLEHAAEVARHLLAFIARRRA